MNDIVILDKTATGFSMEPAQQDYVLKYLVIVNNTGAPVTLNVYISNGNAQFRICPKDQQLAAGTAFETDNIKLKTQQFLVFTVNGSCDYYIDLEPAT